MTYQEIAKKAVEIAVKTLRGVACTNVKVEFKTTKYYKCYKVLVDKIDICNIKYSIYETTIDGLDGKAYLFSYIIGDILKMFDLRYAIGEIAIVEKAVTL